MKVPSKSLFSAPIKKKNQGEGESISQLKAWAFANWAPSLWIEQKEIGSEFLHLCLFFPQHKHLIYKKHPFVCEEIGTMRRIPLIWIECEN